MAIELAAARVGTLSVEQVSKRLEGSLELLTRGGRTAVPRHRTLKGTLDWSYDLLSGCERKVFRKLSVFAEGWTLEALEAVGSDEGVAESEVLELLSGLVEKSLVVAKGFDEGAARYRLLEPVKQYALEMLEERGEAEEAKRAHVQYFLALSEQAESELLGPREAQWYDSLEEEHDNIRAALVYSLEGAEPELGLRLAGAIWWFWHRHGHLSEGLRWLDEWLAKGSRASAIAARVKALGGIGWLAFGQGDVDRMKESASEGLKLSSEAGLGGYYRALFLGVLGDAAWQEGDYERATKLAEESLRLSREANDLGGMANALLTLGTAAMWGSGELQQARAFYEEGLAISREFGSASILRSCLNSLGLTFLLQRDLERAAVLAEEAAALCRDAGDRTLLPLPLDTLGWVALLGGDLERAEAFHKESLALYRELGRSMGTLEVLVGLACTAGATGESEKAAKLFGAAQALHEAMVGKAAPEQTSLEEPYFAEAHSQLEEGVWTAAWEEGRAMSMETAIEHALSEEESSTTTPSSTPELISREVEVLGLVADGLANAQGAQRQEVGQEPPTLVPVPEQPPLDPRTQGLTAREQEVALLVGRRLTNRQIALELSISEHTAANHVRKILKKLGLRSRAQISSS